MRSSRSSRVADRRLDWDGCLNVRDLGGHATEDGGQTVFGAIVRADNARRLSEAGWEALVAYGIRTVIDLRQASELLDDAPRDVPGRVVHVPLLGPASGFGSEADAIIARAADEISALRDVYLAFLERFREGFAAAIGAIARAGEGGVLVHCEGGKDRTGLVAALLLRLASVPPDDVADDYSLSGENVAPRNAAWIAAAESENERKRLERFSATPARAMHGVIEELERRYGSVAGYLRAGGASDADLAAARSRLLA